MFKKGAKIFIAVMFCIFILSFVIPALCFAAGAGCMEPYDGLIVLVLEYLVPLLSFTSISCHIYIGMLIIIMGFFGEPAWISRSFRIIIALLISMKGPGLIISLLGWSASIL